MNRTRQLMIGLDAMEWSVIQEGAASGVLPAFRTLIRQGARAELSTTAAQLPDTVWASIYTGSNPGKLEKYFYVQYDARRMSLRNVPDDEIRRTPFWDYLSRAGIRTGVADVPKFPLSASLNGYQLANWGAHATKTARGSNPRSLIAEIDRRFGRHPVGDCDMVDDRPQSLRDLRARILAGVHLHGEVFRWLLRWHEADVFFASFSAPHCVGHHFWKHHDETHPEHDRSNALGLNDTIIQVYRAVDAEIGRLIDAASASRVMVFAGHGMGPIYHASWNLPQMLELLGYGPESAARAPAAEVKTKTNPWRIVKMVVPGRLQYAIRNSLPKPLQDQLLFLWYAAGRKWAGSRAFAVPNNDSVGAIRVSVRGRDHGGIVAPGDEYRRVCRDIAEALEELRDPATGRPVVRKVTVTHEEFHGPCLDLLPDLTVLWDQRFAWNTVESPRFGRMRIPKLDGRSGSHTAHGFLLASGEGIPAGTDLGQASIYDIAPTVLHAAGVNVPSDLDGQPLAREIAALQ